MVVHIRKMLVDDIESVQVIAKESWHSTYDGIIPIHIQDRFLEMAYNDSILTKRLERTPFYIAEENAKISGFANFSNVKENGDIELSAIYLLPDSQNKGIGTMLLHYGIDQLKPKKVFINVESENTIGKHFYISKHFQVVGEFEELFEGHPLKTVRMALTL